MKEHERTQNKPELGVLSFLLSHYLLNTDIHFDYSTVGIYMSATGCVIGAIGNGSISNFYFVFNVWT